MSPRMLNVREAMVQYLVNNGWAVRSGELMSWAVHPIDRDAPTSAKAFQKDIRRRADLVGQRAQGLDEEDAVRLAIGALLSYQRAALEDGNEALAQFWGAVVVEHAGPALGAPDPTAPPDAAAAPASATAPAPSPESAPAPAGEWMHPVTLPPGRLAQLGSTDGPLEPVGRFAAEVLSAHLLLATVDGDGDLDRLSERAAVAGYLVDLDLAGLAPAEVPEPPGDDLLLAAARAAIDHLGATDLAALARRHSPAAAAVVTRLAAADPGRTGLVARGVGAGLCLAEWQRRPA